MLKTLVIPLAFAAAITGCTFWSPEGDSDPPTQVPVRHEPATSASESARGREVIRIERPTVEPGLRTESASATAVAVPMVSDTSVPHAPASPTPFSEVSSTAEPRPTATLPLPAPTAIRGGTNLPVPAGTSVVWGGCASDGECYWYNFYWAPTHEVVMQPGEGAHKVSHELCHAHQHWSINGGAPLDPSDFDLESWYGTSEGQSYMAAVAGLPWVWTHSGQSGLEDFAWTCGYWYHDPAYLLAVSPERYGWASAHLP